MDREKICWLLSQKPEIVNVFPDWLLSQDELNEFKNTQGLAIAEIAGRDSIAAVLVAIKQYPIKAILPTIAYTGTEYGNWEIPLEKCQSLKQKLETYQIKCFKPIFLGSPRFWWLLCGRYISYLYQHFGFYTPCLGCHLYLHSLRIPLAKLIGAHFIIAGERERHDERIKLNQVDVALDAYVKLCLKFGVNLLLPLRHIYSGEEIERILQEKWEEGQEQLHCVLSKNYQDMEGKVSYNETKRETIKEFFDKFALPLAEKALQTYLTGKR